MVSYFDNTIPFLYTLFERVLPKITYIKDKQMGLFDMNHAKLHALENGKWNYDGDLGKNSASQRTHFSKNFLRNSCLTTTTLQQFPITKQKSTSRLSVLRHSSLFIYFKFLFGTKHYHSPAVQNKTSP